MAAKIGGVMCFVVRLSCDDLAADTCAAAARATPPCTSARLPRARQRRAGAAAVARGASMRHVTPLSSNSGGDGRPHGAHLAAEHLHRGQTHRWLQRRHAGPLIAAGGLEEGARRRRFLRHSAGRRCGSGAGVGTPLPRVCMLVRMCEARASLPYHTRTALLFSRCSRGAHPPRHRTRPRHRRQRGVSAPSFWCGRRRRHGVVSGAAVGEACAVLRAALRHVSATSSIDN